MNSYFKMTVILILFNGFSHASQAKNEVRQLVCEYKTDPLGIDVAKPRLSWQLSSTQNGVMQTAYEIRVAESDAKLSSGKLIWSTGKVTNSQSVNVVYNGPALISSQRVCWQVRVWDS